MKSRLGILIVGFLVAAFSPPDRFRPVWVFEYCSSLAALDEIVQASRAGWGAEAALQAIDDGVCFMVPPSEAVLFKADAIVKRYAEGAEGGSEVIIRGRISSGDVVYRLIDEPQVSLYLVPGADA